MPDIAVIGAGFTGLTASRRLALEGHNVTLYEASDTIGGLAASTSIAGVPAEKAYHFIYQTDEYMFSLLDELGLRDELEFHEATSCTVIDDTVHPMTTPLDLLRFSPLKPHDRVRAGVSALYLQYVRNWEKLTRVTAMEWLNRWAGEAVTRTIWAPLLRGKFDRHYDEVTMAWLWGRIKQRADSHSKGAGGEQLGYLRSGFDSIASALEKDLVAHGGSVRLETAIQSIVERPDGLTIHHAGGTNDHDACLMTVPSQVAGRLLADVRDRDESYFSKLEAVDYLDAVVLLFATDEPISDYYWHNMNNDEAEFVAFLGLSALVGPERTGGRYVYYAADYVPEDHPYMSMDADELRALWFGSLSRTWPHFDESKVVDSELYRFRNAQHVVGIGFDEIIADHRTPMHGVYLANFSQIFPMDRGTNYAVRDGERMAAMISRDLATS